MIPYRRPWIRNPLGPAVQPNRHGIFADRAVGLVTCAGTPRELFTGRAIGTNAPLADTALGYGRLCSSTSVGVYTARREWVNWEITAGPFSLIALWQLDSYAAASARILGYSAGSTGYSFGQSLATGVRRYSIGSTNADNAGSAVWPLGRPMSTVLTYDGTTLSGWFDGAFDASIASGAPTFGTFDRVGAGGDPDAEYTLNGKVLYFGLLTRVLTPFEISVLGRYPLSVYAARRGFIAVMASGDATANGDTVTATASIISGTAYNADATANGATVTATASLIEGVASGPTYNLLICTDQLDDGSWEINAATIAKDGTAGPFGTANEAWRLTEDANVDFHFFNQNMVGFIADNTIHYQSIYAKLATGSARMVYVSAINQLGRTCEAVFDLSIPAVDGTPDHAVGTVTAIGGGWFRCSIAFDSESGTHHPALIFGEATNGSSISVAGDGSSGIYFARPQLEITHLTAYVENPCAGGPTATGDDITVTVSLIAGNASGSADATAAGATLTANASIIAGAASASYTTAAATLIATASLIDGVASAASSAAGQTLTANASLISGAASASGTGNGTTITDATSLVDGTATAASSAAGQTIAATASLLAGSASGSSGASASGATVTAAASIVAGAASASSQANGALLAASTAFIEGAVSAASQAQGFIATVLASIIAGPAFAGIQYVDPRDIIRSRRSDEVIESTLERETVTGRAEIIINGR